MPKLYQKYKLGIIANQDFGTEKRLAAFGFRQYFDIVIASAEKGISKPNLRIFQIALNRANCKPESAIMIGDRIDNDIVPANKIGMKTVWIKQGPSSSVEPNKIEAYPSSTINNLSELLTILS
ncbi:HAD family hydrolase [Streptococcus sp. 121]|nr:HAD family hydrolase [Streptococcus sp. 121]